jgi:hypothetical protein
LTRFTTFASAWSLLATGALGARGNHGQGDARSFTIHGQNPYTNRVTHRDEFKWIAHKSVGQLADMNQPCLPHANVNKCAKFDNIQNITTQFHARYKLVDGEHRLTQYWWLMVKPWVTSRTSQQAHHVVQAGRAWQRACQFAQLRCLSKAIMERHQVELAQPGCQCFTNLRVRQF